MSLSQDQRRRNIESAARFAEKYPERVAETKRRWAEKNRDKVRANNKRWATDNPELNLYVKRKHSLAKYGITPEEFERRFSEQSGVCAICKNPETIANRSLAVDHCHLSLEVRGLLCRECNIGISYFDGKPDWLAAATSYLEKAQCNIPS